MASPSILITGATGNVGAQVVAGLRGKTAYRVASSNPDRARESLQLDANAGVDVVHFDFLDPATFAAAFNGISQVFLVRPPALSNVPKEIVPALVAAAQAGVQHVVFLSLQGVENNRFTPHYKIEQHLVQSGMDYTFLRAGFFMQNLTSTHRDEIARQRVIAVPAGRAKTSFIDVRDIGAVGAAALMQTGHTNQAYTLTGSEALDYFQVAAVISGVLGETVTYTNPSVPGFVLRQLREGHPLRYALVLAMLYTITRFGNAASVSPDVARILGRPPVTFRQFAEDHRAAWQAE